MKTKDIKIEDTDSLPYVLAEIEELHDPYIVDIRSIGNKPLNALYLRDYIWLKELSNKGITEIHFRAKTMGTMKLRRVLDKVRFFDRELVILYSDDQHLKAVKRIINEQGRINRSSNRSTENGEGSKNTLQSGIDK